MVVVQDSTDPRRLHMSTHAAQRNAPHQMPPSTTSGEAVRATTLDASKNEHSPTTNDMNGKILSISQQRDATPSIPTEATMLPQTMPPFSYAMSSPIQTTNVAKQRDSVKQEFPQLLESPQKLRNGSTSYGSSTLLNTRVKMSPSSLSLDAEMPPNSAVRQILYRSVLDPMMESMMTTSSSKSLGNDVLGKVRKLRRRVQLLRIQIHGQRSIVELKRDAKSDADEKYIKWIRTNHVASPGPIKVDQSEILVLESLWRACQVARDEYGPAEDALISMETRLEVEENKLGQAEDRLFQGLDSEVSHSKLQNFIPPQDSVNDSDQESDESSGQSSSVSEKTDELDYDDFLARLGNQDIARESYEELLNEKAMLEAERERRLPFGRDLDADNLHFLAHFEETIGPVKKELEEISEDVERLKQIFMQRGMIDAAGDRIEQFMKPDISHETSQSEVASNHSKLSRQEAVTESNEADSRISPLHEIYRNFINLWLLDKLRCSAFEIIVLAGFVATQLNIIENQQWPLEALRLWHVGGEIQPSQCGIEKRLLSERSPSSNDQRKT